MKNVLSLHKSTILITLALVCLAVVCFFARQPSAYLTDIGTMKNVAVFQWHGWPVPLVYGAVPAHDGETAVEAMNRYLFHEKHIRETFVAWGALFTVGLIVVAVGVETFARRQAPQ